MKITKGWLAPMCAAVLLVVAFGVPLAGVSRADSVKVEIFSWWTGGGEEEGLKAIYKVLERNNPGIEIINATVAGGAGTNAKTALKIRMVNGNPPDSFQVHGGAELIDTYVKTGMMEPITGLLNDWGVKDKFNQQILDMCSYKGQIYSIPVNVHRGNVLWYNKAILARHHIRVPQTMSEFLEACRKLNQAGVIALALADKNKWEATHLFEDILASYLGTAKYNGLWNRKTSFKDPGVKQALDTFVELMQYVNPDHAALTWQDTTKMLYDGKAAFNVMGDWAEGYLKTLGWTPGKQFGYLPVPGTQGSFMVITDTFGLPKGAPHRRGAVTWLKTLASVGGQDAFNPIKGSIPSRLDAERQLYDVYLQSSMKDFAADQLIPSIVHGTAAPEGFITALNETINVLISDGNADRALRSLQKAATLYL